MEKDCFVPMSDLNWMEKDFLLRSHVWSEQEFVEKAAFDFSETEAFIKTAEVLHCTSFYC